MKKYKCEVEVKYSFTVYMDGESVQDAGNKAMIFIHDNADLSAYDYMETHTKKVEQID